MGASATALGSFLMSLIALVTQTAHLAERGPARLFWGLWQLVDDAAAGD
ncbi:MAG: hypothetical protein ACI87O_002441, partial [Planctomycetota bacterium]